MPATTLSDIFIQKLKLGPQRDYWDDRVTGLALRLSQRHKTFILRYRLEGKQKRHTLGRYPALSVAEARQKAKAALCRVAEGKEPATAGGPRGDKGELFGTLARAYIEEYAKVELREKSWRETERLLREFAAWEQRPIQNVTREQVKAVLDAIVARGSPSAANHALAAVRGMMNWCVERGRLAISPCRDIKPPSRAKSRDHVLTKDELVRVWLAAEAIGWHYGAIVRLLILTGQRRGEVVGLRWSELDLSKGQWTIPPERTKAGRHHELPLVPAAVDLIKNLPKVHDVIAFPARGKNHPTLNFSKLKNALDEIAGLSGWRIHDLRRTVASGLAELRVSPHIIERVLNHTTGTLGGVAGIYNRFGYLDEMRDALMQWSDEVHRRVAACRTEPVSSAK